MAQSFQELTHFEVEDRTHPWGKVDDVLMEYPSCRNRYLGVQASMCDGVKEYWAPFEILTDMNFDHRALHLDCHVDQQLMSSLDHLNLPDNDVDELRLQHVYNRRPEWTKYHFKPDGTKRKYALRRKSRMVRLSSLLGWDAMTRDGKSGTIKDILLDQHTLQTIGFMLKSTYSRHIFHFLLTGDQPFMLEPKQMALYVDIE